MRAGRGAPRRLESAANTSDANVLAPVAQVALDRSLLVSLSDPVVWTARALGWRNGTLRAFAAAATSFAFAARIAAVWAAALPAASAIAPTRRTCCRLASSKAHSCSRSRRFGWLSAAAAPGYLGAATPTASKGHGGEPVGPLSYDELQSLAGCEDGASSGPLPRPPRASEEWR